MKHNLVKNLGGDSGGYSTKTPGLKITSSGARFSKVPIINGPGKPSPFISKIEVSKVFHLA